MSDNQFDLYKEINKAVEAALKSRGIANILLAGKTGVGKSTLLNAVFQDDYAATGQGRPVTKTTRKYDKDGVPVVTVDHNEIYAPAYTHMDALQYAVHLVVNKVQ